MEDEAWGGGTAGREQSPARDRQGWRSKDRHPHLRSLLSFVPSCSRVSQKTLKQEQQGRVSPSWTIRTQNVAAVPHKTGDRDP